MRFRSLKNRQTYFRHSNSCMKDKQFQNRELLISPFFLNRFNGFQTANAASHSASEASELKSQCTFPRRRLTPVSSVCIRMQTTKCTSEDEHVPRLVWTLCYFVRLELDLIVCLFPRAIFSLAPNCITFSISSIPYSAADFIVRDNVTRNELYVMRSKAKRVYHTPSVPAGVPTKPKS